MLSRFVFSLIGWAAVCSSAIAADYLGVHGSVIVTQVLQAAAGDLRTIHDIDLRTTVEESSARAIGLLSADVTEMAATARMMTPEERAERVDKQFTEVIIGKQALVLIVGEKIWKGGVQSLTKEQIKGIYEKDIRNWKEVGGPDQAIVYFNRESTSGVWDLFMQFLYGDVRKAPLSKAQLVDNAEAAKTEVEFRSGAVSVIECGAYKPGKGVYALGIQKSNGEVVEPTLLNIRTGRYELTRPLVLIASKQPTGKVREVIEFMLGPKGQAAVRKSLNVPITDLAEPKPAPEKKEEAK